MCLFVSDEAWWYVGVVELCSVVMRGPGLACECWLRAHCLGQAVVRD